MKKIFAIALAVVMVLSIASVAGAAFNWGPSTSVTTNENFGAQVTVEKYALNTGTYGWNYVSDETITAANGADVYYVVKVVLTKDIDPADQEYALSVNYYGVDGTNFSGWVGGQKGDVYYYNGTTWNKVNANTPIDDIVVRARCFDTADAKVSASITYDRDLTTAFSYGSYVVQASANKGGFVAFYKDNKATPAEATDLIAKFYRNNDGLVTKVEDGAGVNGVTAEDVMNLYAWLNDGSATAFQTAVNSDQVYMTNANLWAAFGYSYKSADEATWTATSHPIIVDHNVGIPNTGDNASVIGFAMIMVAVVAAAVAVRKVNA